MEIYKPRKVEFKRIEKIDEWNVKVYTITHRARFESKGIFDNAVANLPAWLARSAALRFPTHRAAFLIVHEGKDGVWSLINWWVGDEMLRSLTFFTSRAMPKEFVALPKEGFLACVWEMAVISFERAMWIEYVLKNADAPDFTGYYEKCLSMDV